MDEIEKRIRDYGQKRDQTSLQQCMEDLNEDTLVSFIKIKYNSVHFVYVWDYILQSFTDSSESHQKRYLMVSALLNELEKGLLSNSQCTEILTRLCSELPKFKSRHLIEICDFCIECIQKGSVSEMCWKQILPEVLKILIECNHVEYNDQDITGLDFKTQLINSLCMLTWSPNIVTSLTSMFSEMRLTKEEHLQVVNKLGLQMDKLTCQELPPFIYQLLKLCRYQNGRSVYLRLQYYFGTRIYSRMEIMRQFDSDSTDLNAIDDASSEDAIEAESTILFHIHQSAGNESIKDYLSSLKNLTKSPEFILHPFQLTLLLTISTISAHKDQVMEILRTSISRTIQEELKQLDCCWFREMLPSTCKIEDIVNQVIKCSLSERYLVVDGLVQLAYTLLGVGQMLGRDGDLACERQWQLGKMIIFKVVKKKRQIAPFIIKSLNNHIVTGKNVSQYIECIHILCQKMSLIMFENQSCVVELMECLVNVRGPIASLLLDAILPLTKVSSTIRDHFILLLRKALYSRVIETRQMAVSAFLKLIKSFKISNLAVISQSSSSSCVSSSSSYSLTTQVTLNCTGRTTNDAFSKEVLCLEILGILRRCFMQQIEVRSELYDGLYDAVCMNPELGIPALDVLWQHFNDIYVTDENTLPPLQFSKITVTKDINVQLQEPLGKLIYTIGLIVTKIQEEHIDNPTVIQLKNVLESLCNRMNNCELIHFELDDGTDLLDNIPESQHKLLVLKETLSVYESLIGYKIASWDLETGKNAQQIYSLFQCYFKLIDFSKSLVKPKKSEKKKQTNETRNTQQSDTATHTDVGVKNSPKPFEAPKTVLDFQTITKFLHLLLETRVSWTTTTEANVIKTKPEIHRHVMQATIQQIKILKSLRTAEVHFKQIYYVYLTEIGAILYDRCIVRLDALLDFDNATSNLAVECFHLILSVVCVHYRNKLPLFLNAVAGKGRDEDLVNVLLILIETYQKLFELEEIESSTDVETKKLHLLIINTITQLSSHIPSTTNALSIQLLDWLKNYMNNKTINNNKQVLSSFINLIFNMQIKFKTTVSLFESVACRLTAVLGTINENEETFDELILINEWTAMTIFPLFCNSLKILLDDIDWIVLRLRSEFGMISYPGEYNPERRREYLKSKERGVCCQLCPIITILSTICNIKIPPGNLSETLLKTVCHLYSSLNALTKYFILRSSKVNIVFQGARFERVVKLAGKQLSTIVYDYIIYIEGFSKQQTQNSQSKKKSVNTDTLKSKVLRETRPIPKAIYEIEQFGRSIFQLSNKTKVDLTKFIGQGSARDFRIRGLQEVLDQAKQKENNESAANVSAESHMEIDHDNVDEEHHEDESPQHPKKKRKS